MDFWSRLLSPLSSGSSRLDQAKDPAKRLHRFEKEYGNLLSTWRTSSNLSRDSDAAETLEIRLQELTNILSDESRRPLPHPCIQYASMKQIYVPIGKIATTSYNEWIIKEAVLFFATLIESEEEAFVENPTFSTSLTNLLTRITGLNSVTLGLDTESRVVELAFNITTKIRLDPEILPAWFMTQHARSHQQVGGGRSMVAARERFTGRALRNDFPLFYILMDYIQHEGKVGDFARTGLLYIIEAASNSASLEQWIVESDLSTLMATGLGALYSQLSRKLVIDHLPHDLPPILALSDYQHPISNYEVISSCSPDFQSHLETFLSHLLFWQDVLNHCRSVEVKSTLLEHFQVIFLQQILYPSLLESSDIDGGSSVAVLTYLRRILESLDHPDMINLILHYLLDIPDAIFSHAPPSQSLISAARKRKSMDLATMMAEKPAGNMTGVPLLFNLVDLILSCLRSRNQQTIYVTLQLVSAILKRHHRYAVLTLLQTDMLPSNTINRTVGAHEQEIEYIVTLAQSIGGSQANVDEAYESILKDTVARLESHPCSLKLISPKMSTTNHKLPAIPDSLPGAPRDVMEHTLRMDDPMLNAILDLLETFFVNPVETNLSVTETIVDMAICGYMSIEGWLARNPNSYSFFEDDEPEDEEESAEEEEEEEMGTDEELKSPPEVVVNEYVKPHEELGGKDAEAEAEAGLDDSGVKAEVVDSDDSWAEDEADSSDEAESAEESEAEDAVQSSNEADSSDEDEEKEEGAAEAEVEAEGEVKGLEKVNSFEEVVAEKTKPGIVVPADDPKPEPVQPEAQPEAQLEAQPEEAQPEEAQPEEAQPEEAQPEEAQPEAQPETQPEAQQEVQPVAQPTEEESTDEESEKLEAMEKCRRRPKWNHESLPRILNVLKNLCDQVSTYKETVPRFEELLRQRQDAFQAADSIQENPMPVRKGTPGPQSNGRFTPDDLSRTGSPRPSGLEGLAHRLLSELGTPSRTSSPQGRKEPSRSSGNSTPRHTSSGPEFYSPKPIAPKQFPINYNDPGRSGITRSYTTSNTRSDMERVMRERENAEASRAADFAAIDQTILARRVGLPGEQQVKSTSLEWDRKPLPALPLDSEQGSEHDFEEEEVEVITVSATEESSNMSESRDDDAESDASEATSHKTDPNLVSVSHVLTNVIIFQSFLLELASLMQVRAGLFNEVRFV